MQDSGAPSPSGRPGPRWEGDGALGGPVPPPREAVAKPRPAGPAGRPLAEIWRRVVAFVIDEVAVKPLFYAVLVFPLVMSTGSVAVPDLEDPMTLLPQFLLGFGYNWIFWAQGWTPGGRLMRIRLVEGTGGPPGMRRGGMRAVVAGLPLGVLLAAAAAPDPVRDVVEPVSSLAFLVGHAWMFWHARRQTWHDLAAGTYVVAAR